MTHEDSCPADPTPVLGVWRKPDEGSASTGSFRSDVFYPSAYVFSYQGWSWDFTDLSPSPLPPPTMCLPPASSGFASTLPIPGEIRTHTKAPRWHGAPHARSLVPLALRRCGGQRDLCPASRLPVSAQGPGRDPRGSWSRHEELVGSSSGLGRFSDARFRVLDASEDQSGVSVDCPSTGTRLLCFS